jgi:hypothetical protein
MFDMHCDNMQCVSTPHSCDDNNQCTVDTCDVQGGAALCKNTNCVLVSGSDCPLVCQPDVCGYLVVDSAKGETCDPPGSHPVPSDPSIVCRADCTYCGDKVVQSTDGETCDDGTTLSGCGPRGFPNDPGRCQKDCTMPMCKDPTSSVLAQWYDRFKFHGRLVVDSAVDFTAKDFAIEITRPSGHVIYRASVPGGSLVAAGNGFRYVNPRAKTSGGIAKLSIRSQGGVLYRTTLLAYGNLLGSQTNMVTHVHGGGLEWTVGGKWQQLKPTLWRFLAP